MEWWKTAVIYQIYPCSFTDSTNNGIGDLQAIINSFNYLVHLGIDFLNHAKIERIQNESGNYRPLNSSGLRVPAAIAASILFTRETRSRERTPPIGT